VERELAADPYAGHLLLALVAFYLVDGDEEAAVRTVARVKKIRPGVQLVRS
jgi:hypothetical protein